VINGPINGRSFLTYVARASDAEAAGVLIKLSGEPRAYPARVPLVPTAGPGK